VKYYSVAEMEITDRSWVAEYVKNVTKMVEQRGGRYLARTSKVETVEGERKLPQVFLFVEWPSQKAAKAFYESEEYRPYREARIAGAKIESLLVAGEDVTKTAHIAE
jgi:uncharacterized protein (DUF1330 family)